MNVTGKRNRNEMTEPGSLSESDRRSPPPLSDGLQPHPCPERAVWPTPETPTPRPHTNWAGDPISHKSSQARRPTKSKQNEADKRKYRTRINCNESRLLQRPKEKNSYCIAEIERISTVPGVRDCEWLEYCASQ